MNSIHWADENSEITACDFYADREGKWLFLKPMSGKTLKGRGISESNGWYCVTKNAFEKIRKEYTICFRMVND